MKTFKFTLFSLAIIFVVSASSCDSTREVTDGNTKYPQNLEIQQVNQGVLTGDGAEPVGKDKGYVIQTEEEWENLRNKMNTVNNAQAQVSIDFEKYTVVAYFDQIRPNGGYSIDIVEAIESKDMVNIMYKSTAPTGMATTVITQPFTIVKVQKTEKTVKFLPVTAL